MWLTPYITGPELFVPAHSSCKKKKNICTGSWKNGSTLMGSQQHKAEDQRSCQKKNNRRGTNTSCSTTAINQMPHMVVPYTKGLSQSLKKPCSKHGVQVYFRGDRTIRNLLLAPKDKYPIIKKSGVIYRYKCDRLKYDEEDIGVSSRTFGERFKEHLKAPSPIYDHSNSTGHMTTIENFSTVVRTRASLEPSRKHYI